MACGRPGGYSDSDQSDDDFLFDRPQKRVNYYTASNVPDSQKAIENDLQAAIAAGDLDKALKVIQTKLKAEINTRLSSSWTPLMHACFQAQAHIVDRFLEFGADPNLHGASVTPMMAACSNDTADGQVLLEIVRQLLDKGAFLNMGDMYGSTALMRAVIGGHADVVRELLAHNVNPEMRDMQGWTAVYWAVHHNRAEILELLIEYGARLSIVDKNCRSPLDIAESHNHQTIVDLLKANDRHEEEEALELSIFKSNMSQWFDYYPGLKYNNEPTYAHEIPKLLYGMNCEKLAPIFETKETDLKTFLLMDEADMIELGVELPYERKRLKLGLMQFHTKGWKVEAVAGLYVKNQKNYSVIDCLTALGSHFQQAYIMEATLRYAIRDYTRLHAKDDSLTSSVIYAEAAKISNIITSIKKETNIIRTALKKIASNNPQPANLICKNRSTSSHHILGTVTTFIAIITIAGIVYRNRFYYSFNK